MLGSRLSGKLFCKTFTKYVRNLTVQQYFLPSFCQLFKIWIHVEIKCFFFLRQTWIFALFFFCLNIIWEIKVINLWILKMKFYNQILPILLKAASNTSSLVQALKKSSGISVKLLWFNSNLLRWTKPSEEFKFSRLLLQQTF